LQKFLIKSSQTHYQKFLPNRFFLSAKAKDVVGDTSSYTGVYVYNNIFAYTHGKAVMFENVDDSYICNNTFYGMNPTQPNAQNVISLSASSERNTVVNNIYYNEDDQTTNPMFIYAPHDFHVDLGSPAIEGALSFLILRQDWRRI
jgi:hypothetical protein